MPFESLTLTEGGILLMALTIGAKHAVQLYRYLKDGPCVVEKLG